MNMNMSSRNSSRHRRSNSPRLGVDVLEGRALMAASVLTVTGLNVAGHTSEAVPAKVATFTDSNSGLYGANTPTYTPTVTEGTGPAVPSTVMYDSNIGGYDVFAVFPPGAAATTPFNVTISGVGTTGSATGSLTVSGPTEATPFPPSKVTYSFAGAGFLTASAELDLPGTLPSSDFAATVDWGDGSAAQSAPLSVTYGTVNGAAATIIKATPTHQYVTFGTFPVRIAMSNAATGGVDGADFLTVLNGLSQSQGPNYTGLTAVAKIDTQPVGLNSFQADASNPPASAFTASINWGDGSPPSSGTISRENSGVKSLGYIYSILGDHTYASGTGAIVPVVTTVTSQFGETAQINSGILVYASLNQRYVANLYTSILKRTAEPGGLNAYTAAIDSGQMTRAQAALSIENSPEGIAVRVTQDYYHIVGRYPDPTSLSQGEQLLSSGGSDELLKSYYQSSPELYARDGGTDAGYLEALYNSVLGRAIDAGALNGYESELSSGQITRLQVANITLSSVEAHNLVPSRDFVGGILTPAESMAINQAFAGGASDEQALAMAYATTDYFNLSSVN